MYYCIQGLILLHPSKVNIPSALIRSGVFLVNVSYLLISTVAQPTGCPGSGVHGVHVGPCERQEGGEGGKSGAAAEVGREGRSWEGWMEQVQCFHPSIKGLMQPSTPYWPAYWAASREVWPAGQGRGFCPSAPLW